MKINPVYRKLLDNSVSSMLSAIEIYNKPNFNYREESFAILAVNSWELLLKAYILKCHKYNMNSIYDLEYKKKKDGSKSSRQQPKLNRCGNPQSINIHKAIIKIKDSDGLSDNLIKNLECLIELRDNTTHLINMNSISKQIQELGFSCIKNYVSIIKKWRVEIDLSEYNFYLMPLAYLEDNSMSVDGILTESEGNYIKFIQSLLMQNEKASNDEFSTAISIKVEFSKGNTINAIPTKNDSNGISISATEEQIFKQFPFTHGEIWNTCKTRYSNFKYNGKFHAIMNLIKKNPKLSYERKLNNKSKAKTHIYNSNIWQELDKNYIKVK
jgi:hypothetical protein